MDAAPRLHTGLYITLAIAILLMALALRVPSFFEPRWYGDEGIFASIAHNMREGRVLYAEAWDNKPPLIFATYAAIQSLFGTGVMPLHIVTAFVVIAAQVAVMAIAFRLYGAWRSLVAAAVFALLMCTPLLEGNLALTETYMILPATLAVFVYVVAQQRQSRPYVAYAAAGVLMGGAIAYKQVAVFDAAAIATMIWLTSDRPVRAVAPYAAGVAAPHFALLALFALLGALPQYMYAMVGAQGVYAGLVDEDLVASISGYIPVLLVVAYLVRRQRLGGDVGVRHLPMLWFGFALAGATASPFAFPHYLQQVAPAASLLVVSSPLPAERDDLGRIALVAAGLLTFSIVLRQYGPELERRDHLNPLLYYETFVERQRGDLDTIEYMYRFDGSAVTVKDISNYINEDGAGRTLFAWSEHAWVYAAAGATNPARYYSSFYGDEIPGASSEILEDLRASPPVYVVISDSAYAPFEELETFVAQCYELLRAQGDWRLYRLSSASGRLAAEPAEARGAH